MSFQITVLKVLAGHPDGRASVTELTRYVSVFMSSGSDWTDRMRRLAARAPKLDIFPTRLCCGTITVGRSRIMDDSFWLCSKRRSLPHRTGSNRPGPTWRFPQRRVRFSPCFDLL